jgi:hypothetical protein
VSITDSTGTGAAATATLDLTTLTGGMHKFVDLLPGVPGVSSYVTTANGYNSDGTTNLGQSMPLATPTSCTYSGQAADCYEIALVEFKEQMHSDLGPTTLRGYVQIEPPGSAMPLGSSHVLLPGVFYKGTQI